MPSRNIRPLTLLVDLTVLALGVGAVFVFWKVIPPSRRGFFCNDPTLRHTQKPSTVPNSALYSIGFGIPLITIFLLEFFSRTRVTGIRGIFLGRQTPLWAISIYQNALAFLMGAVGSQLFVFIGKCTAGSLRPNFIATCRPNVTLTDCEESPVYIEDYSCMGDDRKGRTSFPSAHASFSTYAMTFGAIALGVKWTGRSTAWLRIGLQLVLLLIAYYTSLSRVADNKHHPVDILGGALNGFLFALITGKLLSFGGPRGNSGFNAKVVVAEEGVPLQLHSKEGDVEDVKE